MIKIIINRHNLFNVTFHKLIWEKICEFCNYFNLMFLCLGKNKPVFPMPNRGSGSFKTAKGTCDYISLPCEREESESPVLELHDRSTQCPPWSLSS